MVYHHPLVIYCALVLVLLSKQDCFRVVFTVILLKHLLDGHLRTPSPRDLSGTVAVVTGVYKDSLGYHTVHELASLGASVILACPSTKMCAQTKNEILLLYPDAEIEGFEVHQCDIKEIKRFSRKIKDTHTKVDYIVNYASSQCKDTILHEDYQMYLSQVSLTYELKELLEESHGTVVSVTSSMAIGLLRLDQMGVIELDSLLSIEEEVDSSLFTFAAAKLATALSVLELQDRFTNISFALVELGSITGKVSFERNVFVQLYKVYFQFLVDILWRDASQGIIYMMHALLECKKDCYVDAQLNMRHSSLLFQASQSFKLYSDSLDLIYLLS